MATIQIRNVPETVHRIYQARAAAAGMSLEDYLRTGLVHNAELRTPSELVAEMDQRMAAEDTAGFQHKSSASVIRTDRASH